ncbi:MAG: carbohydrate-binding domain-containing protein, partial [Bacteroidaceae bacterium]|nr:carbohydrate-binding domain-containing protein [Bacteroidaceae bacterium]
VTTTGGKFTYTNQLTSSPKGVKADGDVNISGGTLNISVTGRSDGSEGLESKQNLTIGGGTVYVYAYDDAINAGKSITINGGTVFAHAINNDAIDSNGTMTINGGYVVASGTGVPEGGFDADMPRNFTVNGGTLIGIGGDHTQPNTNSKQNSVIYGSLTAAKDATLTLCNSSGTAVLSYKLHRTLTGMSLFLSDSKLTNGSYTIKADGSEIGSFTVSGTVTTVGTSSGGGMGGGGQQPGGGGPGGPGGGFPGGGW